ncbi:tetratricopeptide repeat protein [Amylibacter sp. IMCC11727]|uniref:tetratricopeptide repeat protein n=1 Tax=Amylibacter sp. IMCC11727 TaxID=3039851 RepID=UPI00244E3DAB|nr:tetratricopeptide repeat protein [Amylibacter sp. IMCC11727]WGI22570.1 tetratricopeptide repeat protein [Amylibacter sp. IMCC11727]
MLRDRYDNELTTSSEVACAQYIEGVDRVLSGAADMAEPFQAAVAADDGFTLAYVGLARALVLSGDMPAAKAAMVRATELAEGASGREASHVNAMGLLFKGKAMESLAATREHVLTWPRDVIIAQLATSVFGLIGFSGQAAREASMFAYTESLLPHYGEDWWLLSQHAFSMCEVGMLGRASKMIDRSLDIKPNHAHAAHVRSHVYYEQGNLRDGVGYLEEWLGSYEKRALMHGHLSWHVALWALEQGDVDKMWATVDAGVKPNASEGLAINTITDTASILYRAELAGHEVSADRWKQISEYTAQMSPKVGQSFIDMHAALAHAMAGEGELLKAYIDAGKGFAADVVRDCAKAFDAMTKQDWAGATRALTAVLVDDARLGGSRAQRDLLELSLANVLMRQGKGEEAERILGLRRPILAHGAH